MEGKRKKGRKEGGSEGGRKRRREAASLRRLQLESWSPVSTEGKEEGGGRRMNQLPGAAPELRVTGAERGRLGDWWGDRCIQCKAWGC